MFLDLKVEDFNCGDLSASESDIQDYKSRNGGLTADIQKYLLDETNVLSVKAIENHLFPKSPVDVFISHSHADENDAISLAIALESLGLSVFVDSCVWGYADDLLWEVDQCFSAHKNKEDLYSYQLRNRTTANVHMILNSSLHAMIDKSELLVFLGTENSLSVQDVMGDDKYLSSPWIFSELIYAGRTKRTPRRSTRLALEHAQRSVAGNESKGVVFHYELPMLTANISNHEFQQWLKGKVDDPQNHICALQYLDELYKIVGLSDEVLAAERFIVS